MIVIIPTAREINLNYLSPLIDHGARFIIVDDSPGNISVNHPSFEVYNWNHQEKMLGQHQKAIPRKNGACRDFGFYIAWKESDKEEIIIALDDDCDVVNQDFASLVEASLEMAERPVATGTGLHLNALDLYEDIPKNVFPRGFPYSSRIDYKEAIFIDKIASKPSFNLGLWTSVFDINAIDKIKGPEWNHPNATLKHPGVVVPKDTFISVCSMNMHFRSELIPAVYQLPMHVEVFPGWPIDRYGDIWGGFILKLLMDIKGDTMTMGSPIIDHLKEGNYERNIWQEHTCHLVNDEFIDLLLLAKDNIQPSNYVDMMANLNEIFKANTDHSSKILARYLTHLTDCIDHWCIALKK
ncbi:MAG: hypothetical protein R2780_13495 [Crocinitomicaceae bacterium]|nr:hypothetical protein [Crocinitomicaceae bacterium]